MKKVIEATGLGMVYKRAVVQKGKMGVLKDLFHRQYIYYEALKDLSLSVGEGEILGYLGPNGAGKSTTIKILTGVMYPTSGQVLVNGISPHKNRVENGRMIALVSGQRSNLYWDLPVYESFELHKRLYKIPEKQYRENLDTFHSLLNLQAFIHTPVRQLSLGQRIMSDFALAFLHNPSIAYLDEPTIGLDVTAKENIIHFLREINQRRKVTLLITSHDLTDIEKLCEKILIIDQGRKIYEGSKKKLVREYCNDLCTIIMEVEDGLTEMEDLYIPGCEITRANHQLRIAFSHRDKNPTDIIMEVMRQGYSIKDFTIQETTLEDAIKKIYSSEQKE